MALFDFTQSHSRCRHLYYDKLIYYKYNCLEAETEKGHRNGTLDCKR